MDNLSFILRSVWGVSLAVVFFGFTIFIHELGHFLAAKKRGLKVERFSIGFGPRVWGWTGKDGVDYRISLFPLGGYVALPQMADMSAVEGGVQDDAEKLPKVGYADKLIVAVMGATFNVLFACVLACLLSIFGRPQLFDSGLPVVGYIETELTLNARGDKAPSPAFKSDLRLGDRIIAVDGRSVSSFEEIVRDIASGTGRDTDGRPAVTLTVERDGKPLPDPIRINPVAVDKTGANDLIRTIGVQGVTPVYVVVSPDANAPAAKGGLKDGDRIVSINGAAILSFDHFREAIVAAGDAPLNFVVERKEGGSPVRHTLTIVPEKVTVTNPLLALEFWENGVNRRVELVPVPENPAAPGADTAPRTLLMVRKGLPSDSAFADRFSSGNILYAADGSGMLQNPADFAAFAATVKGVSKDKPVTLYLRNDREGFNVVLPHLATSIVPGQVESFIGVGPQIPFQRVRSAPWVYVADTFSATFDTLKAFLTPKSDIGLKHFTGVIGISRIYYVIADNIMGVVWITLVLNINLAVMNLLPLPVLDGGHMVYATIEKLRGRPLPMRVVEVIQTAFVILLFGLMAFILWRDISRWKAESVSDNRDLIESFVRRKAEFAKPAKSASSVSEPASR